MQTIKLTPSGLGKLADALENGASEWLGWGKGPKNEERGIWVTPISEKKARVETSGQIDGVLFESGEIVALIPA